MADERSHTPTPERSGFLNVLRQFVSFKLLVFTLALVATGLALVALSFGRTTNSLTYYLLQEAGKAILISAVLNGGVKWYITRQTAELDEAKSEVINRKLFTSLDTLRAEVLSQTERMAAGASSLAALQAADVSRFYSTRGEATHDLRLALTGDGVSSIRIIGISLNDFVRDESRDLHAIWETLERHIRSGEPPAGTDSLEIKVLLIDPTCQGARMRSEAESQQDTGQRLSDDVHAAIRLFRDLEKNSRGTRVRFSARLYRTAPILYLVWTPDTSFVQQYYFRPSHKGIKIPVTRFHPRSLPGEGASSIHQELQFHFDWLWDHASVTLSDYTERFACGVDEAIHVAGIRNMYYEARLARSRLLTVMNQTEGRLWIKGISLHSFFQYNDLFDALHAAIMRGVDVRILLIDPDGDQARFRSFREFRIDSPDASWDSFNEGERRKQRLHRDTTESVQRIEALLSENEARAEPLKFEARLFVSGPEAFTMLTDRSALIEQYHYGKIRPVSRESLVPGRTLVGDVPLVEYEKIDHQVVPKSNPHKDPYRIFEDSFTYVFTISQPISAAH